jgi:hypothetical protein
MSSLSDCTWLEKEWSFVSQQRDILPYTFFFFSFTWFIPLISLLLPHLSLFFLLSFFHSHNFSFTFFFFLYFFSILILFLFIFLSLDNFSKLSTLSFSHAYNMKFQINHARDETKPLKVGCVQGMRCTKEIYWVGMEFVDARDFQGERLVTECMTRLATKDKHKNMIIARN